MIAPAVHFIYQGGGRDEIDIPDEVRHVTTHESVTFIPEWLFYEHRNIVELICHENVVKIESNAFEGCPRLERLIMNGVEEVEWVVFSECTSLEDIECNNLEIIGPSAFEDCESLSGINLPSARNVGNGAFCHCEAMKEVTFGKDLESVDGWAFECCYSLERITIPLKNGLFPRDDTFVECNNLRQVFLVEGEVVNDTVASLFLESWRNEMRTVIDSINHNLPNAYAGDSKNGDFGDGEKATVIRSWISSVLSKIIHYKAQHRILFNAAKALLLSLELPDEIVMNNVLPFLELPSHTFHGEDNTVVINPDLADLELPRELDDNATGLDASDTSNSLLQLLDAVSI